MRDPQTFPKAGPRASIEEHGILEPLMVQNYDDDLYLLLEGERRWTVGGQLGIEEVPAIVVNRQDPEARGTGRTGAQPARP